MLRRVMMASAAGGATYLDQLAVTPVTAYGLKKLISTATVAIRVRRSSDNTEQDIGFSGDALDTSALASFVGAGSGYIRNWYDQVGGSFNLEHSTASNQPRIVDAGAIDSEVVFNGTTSFLGTSSNVTAGTNYLGVYSSLRAPTGSGSYVMFESSTNSNSVNGLWGLFIESSRLTAPMRTSGGYNVLSFGISRGSRKTLSVLIDRSAAVASKTKCWQDGVSQTASLDQSFNPTGNFTSDRLFVGARSGAIAPAPMGAATIAVYNADTTAIRAAIEAIVAA